MIISDREKNIADNFLVQQTKYWISTADPYNRLLSGCYNAFWYMPILVRYAYKRKHTTVKDMLLRHAIDISSKVFLTMGYYRDLRASGNVRFASSLLSNTTKTGPTNHPAFLGWDFRGRTPVLEENQLYTYGFVGYLSLLLKDIFYAGIEPETHYNEATTVSSLTSLELSYFRTITPTLVTWLVNIWENFEHTSGWTDGYADYQARLDDVLDTEYVWTRPFERCLIDTEKHILSVASVLTYLCNAFPDVFNSNNITELSPTNIAKIKLMRDYYQDLYDLLLSPDDNYVFQPGAMYGHQDYDFVTYQDWNYTDDSYTAPSYPDPYDYDYMDSPYIASDCAQDTGHGAREPIFVSNLRDSYINESANDYAAMDLIFTRLGNQYAEITDITNGIPVTRNYMDGRNGWYRVFYGSDPTEGWAPYAQGCNAFTYPTIMSLGANVPQIKELYRQIIEALSLGSSATADAIADRTRYWGSGRTEASNRLGTVDTYSSESTLLSSVLYANYLFANIAYWGSD